MNPSTEDAVRRAAALAESVHTACSRIAPQWPLESAIAVNPWWGWMEEGLPRAAAHLAPLSGARLWMPRRYYRDAWQAGRLRFEHLEAAARSEGGAVTAEAMRAALDAPDHADDGVGGRMLSRSLLVSDGVDRQRDTRHAVAWRDHIAHQISQHCAAHFDAAQARWRPHSSGSPGGLYTTWRHALQADHGARWLMGAPGLGAAVRSLPEEASELLAAARPARELGEAGLTAYFTALLLSVNGWASWCACRRWQARLEGGQDAALEDLLAIRLAWEHVLWTLHPEFDGKAKWRQTWEAAAAALPAQALAEQALDRTLQRALEWAWQAPLCAALSSSGGAARAGGFADRPHTQAVFCIDVRSEVFRRALEAADSGVQTRGFAGFFGLPVDFKALGSHWARPQLPGLLAPSWHAAETADSPHLAQALKRRRQSGFDWQTRWKEFRTAAASSFSFVEVCGLFYGAKLLRSAWPEAPLFPASARAPQANSPGGASGLALLRRPAHEDSEPAAKEQTVPDATATVDLLAGILTGMGLTTDFSRLVLICGHGSQSANNPHECGLHCGACGGQTGEVNARLLANLLQQPAHRAGLAQRGIEIPADTAFVAGLHNTVTDEVELFDLHCLPESYQADVNRLRASLALAGRAARAERAPALGLKASPQHPDTLLKALRARARDGSELRPEWGLANNAAFIVAPRARSAQINLQGRAFLHDYDASRDVGFRVLEQIMTAPMLVAHWINLCYYASTVDPLRYGSGNKLLHNVVGGRIGVFEGNGGDLKVGLAWQSVHDGERLRHEPLRLSVFIAAPAGAIDAVLAKHRLVAALVEGAWLHLFALDGPSVCLERRGRGEWVEVECTASPS